MLNKRKNKQDERKRLLKLCMIRAKNNANFNAKFNLKNP